MNGFYLSTVPANILLNHFSLISISLGCLLPGLCLAVRLIVQGCQISDTVDPAENNQLKVHCSSQCN